MNCSGRRGLKRDFSLAPTFLFQICKIHTTRWYTEKESGERTSSVARYQLTNPDICVMLTENMFPPLREWRDGGGASSRRRSTHTRQSVSRSVGRSVSLEDRSWRFKTSRTSRNRGKTTRLHSDTEAVTNRKEFESGFPQLPVPVRNRCATASTRGRVKSDRSVDRMKKWVSSERDTKVTGKSS